MPRLTGYISRNWGGGQEALALYFSQICMQSAFFQSRQLPFVASNDVPVRMFSANFLNASYVPVTDDEHAVLEMRARVANISAPNKT